MKHILIFATMILCLINTAYGKESNIRLSIQGETLENGSAATIGISTGMDYFYGGLSLSYIHSSKVIQYSQRRTIYPLYLFFGLQGPWKYSPFIEAGFDLGDSLINDLYNNEDDDVDLVDYYYSGGLMFKATDTLSLALYAKKYNFKFREDFSPPTIKTRPYSYGLGAVFRF